MSREQRLADREAKGELSLLQSQLAALQEQIESKNQIISSKDNEINFLKTSLEEL